MTTTTENFTVREQCGRAWRDELLSFPLTFAPGVQADLRLALGAKAPLPTQFTDVRRYPDGSVAGVTAWCRVSLAPEETLTLSLRPAEAPASTLTWQEVDGGFEAANAHFAVRVPASGVYPADAVPGPVTAVHVGAWLGSGRVASPSALVVTTTLLEHGPLFLRWSVRYHFETRTLATVTCTLYAGEEFLRLDEVTSRDAELDFRFNTTPGLTPDALLTKGGGEHIDQQVRPLDYARPETLATIDFHSGHHQMGLTWAGLYNATATPFLGVIELDGDRWTNTSVNRLFLTIDPPGTLEIVSPLRGGYKAWALLCSTTARNLKPHTDKTPNLMSRIHTRYAEIPLQKVKDWVLDWEAEAPAARPFLQCDADGVAAARARVQADPDMLRAYQAWTAALDAGKNFTGSRASGCMTAWVAQGDDRLAHEAADALEAEIRKNIDLIWDEGMYMRLIIFTGRAMKMWLQAYDLLHAGGFLDEARDRRVRRDLAFLAYAFADNAFFPHQFNLADHNDPDSYFHGLGARIGDTECPPNFHTEYYTTFGMMGCTFRTHPMAAAWRARAAELLDRQFEVHFYDSGAYNESPNYHAHVFVMLTQTALALWRAGERNFFQHPRVKAQFDYFNQIATPPVLQNPDAQHYNLPHAMLDPDRERYVMLPGNGNSGHNCSDQPLPIELAVGAALYRATDPDLSARCMTSWTRGGRRICNHYDDLTFLLIADPSLPCADVVGASSRVLTGAYVTFRAQAETADEVYVLTKNGTATHHNDFDEGGFTIWAYGAPASSDYGYHADHNGRSYGVGETWKHNCVEFDGKSSGYLGIEQTSSPERFLTTPRADLLVSYLPITNFRDVNQTYMDQVPAQRIEYRRYTLFVKPHYLFVYDSIQSCAYTHRWWLHAQADDVQINGPRVRFAGKYGVDLLAHFVTPAAPAITAGEWSVMRHIAAVQAQNKDWRVFVAPVKSGQAFDVTSTAAGRVVTVTTPDYTDTLFLAHYPFAYADDTVTFQGKAGIIRRTPGGVETTLLDGEVLTAK
jgi:hypothetical protein